MADIELSISSEKVCFIIAKAREFEVKDVVTVPDEASNPSDDRMIEVLEDRPNEDAVLQELHSIIGDMSEDEQIDLVALAWLGRGDAGAESWQELRGEAARAHNPRTAAYLLAHVSLDPLRTLAPIDSAFACGSRAISRSRTRISPRRSA